MDRERDSAEDLLRRVAMDYWFGPERSQAAVSSPPAQRIPVNMYETPDDIVLAAPMPGVEAENLDIQIMGTTVTLRASLRGPHQADRHYFLHEWTYGPYERTVTLPVEVDAERANASHGNGILVVTLPKASKATAVRVPLQKVSSSITNRQGHSGHHTVKEGLAGEPPD